MIKYKTKDLSIDAIQYRKDNLETVWRLANPYSIFHTFDEKEFRKQLTDIFGIIAQEGDWIIIDGFGNLYRCTENIFELVFKKA